MSEQLLPSIGVRGFRMSREEAANWIRAAEAATMDVRACWHEYKYTGPLYADRVATASSAELLEWARENIYDGNPPEMAIGALLLAAARGDP